MGPRLFGVALLAVALVLPACGGGGGGGATPPTSGLTNSPVPVPTGSSTATPTPGAGGSPSPSPSPNTAAFTCPSSATTFAVGQQAVRAQAATIVRRPFQRRSFSQAPAHLASSTLLAVTYSSASAAVTTQNLESKVRGFQAHSMRDLTFDRVGRSVRILSVPSSSRDAVASALRMTPGVLNVAPVQRRYSMTTNAYITSDPFFQGNSTPNLYEDASTLGQWDMHVESLEHAFAYSGGKNGSGITNANALGSTSVKLAIVDTGVDVTHPDLANTDIVRTQCFITDTNGHQSIGTFVTDPDGHGTDVAGIAGANVNNNYGFVGDAGNVGLMFYRVFPTPDSTCANPSNPNVGPQCSADSSDIAAAINDAVAHNANVISLSFGGGTCVSGQDPDTVEGMAIANAIAHNVIVTAASGNAGGSGVDAPACDPGVIAVGATAYNDGQPNGTTSSPGATPVEYVPSYSQYGSPDAPDDPNSWGIVAPGGDAASVNDQDNLHWIANLWTSTPFDASDAGFCGTDPFGGANDCYILINGTSMSTPHVGGAAALILSVNSSYGTPAKMKQLLCSTADDLGSGTHEGCGRINVYRAMATALNDPNKP